MYGTVADFLRDKIQDGSSLSIVSAYFTIYAFEKLKDELTNIKKLRFLFGEPSFIDIDPDKTESKAFQLAESGLKLQNYLPQKEVAKACADWIKEKVEIRSVRKSNFLHGKMYYIENDKTEDAIIGSSNFTVRGLGLSETTSNIELNLEVDSKTDCSDLKEWFDNLWESDESEELITKTEAEQLLNYAAEPSVNWSFSERHQFLKLPKEERERILSEQAEEMADFYENDTEWREWEGGPIVEYDTP